MVMSSRVGTQSNMIAVAQDAPSDVRIVATLAAAYWLYSDGSWANTHTVAAGDPTSRVQIHPANPSLMLINSPGYSNGAANVGRYMISTNGGNTWTRYQIDANYNIGNMICDPSNNRAILATAYPNYNAPDRSRSRVYRSTDNGVTWTILADNSLGVFGANQAAVTYDIAVSPNGQTIFYNDFNIVSGLARIWRSIDGGTTWAVSYSLTGQTVTFQYLYLSGNRVIAIGPDARTVYESQDLGLTWTTLQVLGNPGDAVSCGTSPITFKGAVGLFGAGSILNTFMYSTGPGNSFTESVSDVAINVGLTTAYGAATAPLGIYDTILFSLNSNFFLYTIRDFVNDPDLYLTAPGAWAAAPISLAASVI